MGQGTSGVVGYDHGYWSPAMGRRPGGADALVYFSCSARPRERFPITHAWLILLVIGAVRDGGPLESTPGGGSTGGTHTWLPRP